MYVVLQPFWMPAELQMPKALTQIHLQAHTQMTGHAFQCSGCLALCAAQNNLSHERQINDWECMDNLCMLQQRLAKAQHAHGLALRTTNKRRLLEN